MVSYSGGKYRTGHLIGKVITDMANAYGRIRGYCEPFCGMCSVMKNVKLENTVYIANDINANIIEMWRALQNGWIPPRHKTIDRSLFQSLVDSPDISAMKGFYLLHGNNGDWGKKPTYSTTRPPISTSDDLINIVRQLGTVHFMSGDYQKFSSLKNFCIYLDPPYENAYSLHIQSDGTKHFDHKRFNKWCVKLSKNNLVFISAYVKPDIPCQLVYTCPIGRVRQGKPLPLEQLYLVVPGEHIDIAIS